MIINILVLLFNCSYSRLLGNIPRILLPFFLFIATTVAEIHAEEKFWFPNKNPAIITRKITAFTSPSRYLDIAPEFSGIVKEIFVQEGEKIRGEKKSKSVVMKLDDQLIELARDRARNRLELTKEEVTQAKLDLEIRERVVSYRQKEVKRIESLADSGKVREADLDLAIFEYDRSQLELKKARIAIRTAEALFQESTIDFADAEERLARHSLYGPSEWILLDRLVEVGAFVQSGKKVLRFADTEKLAIHVRLSEEEVIALQNIGTIEVHFVRYKHFRVEAKIHNIDVDYDPVTNKRLIELRIPGDQAPVKSGGLEVELSIRVADTGGLIFIPPEFVSVRLEQHFVTLDNGNEIAIIPLRREGENIIVSSSNLPENAILQRIENLGP